ncbi:hypothetical protein J6590_033010 [Homalodisca vitripennis]|nr:hypothetical protein J6590_033010 [Homalodisca vitripennis]
MMPSIEKLEIRRFIGLPPEQNVLYRRDGFKRSFFLNNCRDKGEVSDNGTKVMEKYFVVGNWMSLSTSFVLCGIHMKPSCGDNMRHINNNCDSVSISAEVADNTC